MTRRTRGIEALTPLQAGGLQEGIYRALRDGITSGIFTPGERLRELQLARRFQTSQAPVREALRRLAQEGLVVSLPHRGTFVIDLSHEEVEEVYSLRAELESWAIRRFIQRVTAADLDELRLHVASMEAAAQADDQSAFVEADIRFHRTICAGSGSALLLQLWAPVDSRVRGMMAVGHALHERGLDYIAGLHPPILDAIVRRDLAAADTLIREHMRRVWDEIGSRLRPTMSSPLGPPPSVPDDGPGLDGREPPRLVSGAP